ncbi:decaprenyl-phosphate phosphoribosyltransferase [soil metagenome]
MLRLTRPKQWIKNSFVLAPLIFARAYSDIDLIERALFAFALFCVASSACYIVNDIRDVERDRAHPVKSWSRPLAARHVTLQAAIVLLVALYVVLIAGFIVMPSMAVPILSYIALNLAYSFFLKDQPVIDIFSVAGGFVIRVWGGSAALGVPLSSWMAITTLCLALFLASIKRRTELAAAGSGGRKVLKEYSLTLVDRYAEMSAMGALLFYSLFVMSTNQKLAATIPLVLFGMFRYWYVVETREGGETPTDVLLTDWPLIACILIWGGVCLYALMP